MLKSNVIKKNPFTQAFSLTSKTKFCISKTKRP